MHWLDITILIVLGIGAVFGFWSGLLWQIARVVSLCLSLYLAIAFNSPMAEWLATQWKDTSPAVCRIAGFVVIFLVVYVVLYLFTQLLHETIKASKLEFVDRVLGALLGMAKMAAIVSAVCAALVFLALPVTQTWMEESAFVPLFAEGTDAMIGLIPRELRDRLDENLGQARDHLRKRVTDAAVDTLKGEPVNQ
jgi:membrane protein required for colicin V production